MRNEYAAALAAGDLPADGEEFEGHPQDETTEIEHEGQFYRVPGALKDAFLAKADHDRQMRELAEHQRALARDRGLLDQRMDVSQAGLQARTLLAVYDHQLEAFQGVDWGGYAAEDPQGAQALWAQFETMAQAREEYAQAVAQHDQQAERLAALELSDRLTEVGRTLSREIEGWSPEVAQKLVEYAAAFGVTLDELREVADARLWKILHRAYAGEEVQKRDAKARNAAQAQVVRPAVQVAGAAAGSGGVRDELGTAEWMRRRNEQMLRGG